MFYQVKWLKGSAVIDEKSFRHLLEAKAFAKDRLAIQKVRKGVTAALVVDADGVSYFRFGEEAG